MEPRTRLWTCTLELVPGAMWKICGTSDLLRLPDQNCCRDLSVRLCGVCVVKWKTGRDDVPLPYTVAVMYSHR